MTHFADFAEFQIKQVVQFWLPENGFCPGVFQNQTDVWTKSIQPKVQPTTVWHL